MASGIQTALQDIVSLVVTAVASEGNIGDNVFLAGGDNEGLKAPYAMVELESLNSRETDTHDGAINAQKLDFSVHIHTRTKNQGLQLIDLVIDGLHGKSGTQGSTNFGHILRDGAVAHFTTETKTNEAIVDFTSLITN